MECIGKRGLDLILPEASNHRPGFTCTAAWKLRHDVHKPSVPRPRAQGSKAPKIRRKSESHTVETGSFGFSANGNQEFDFALPVCPS